MCFLAILMLKRALDTLTFAKMLQDLGFSVEVRNGVVEAWRGRARLRAVVDRDRIEVETDDYGRECLRDYEAIVKSLIELDTDPKIVYFSSPYVYGYEKKRGKLKKLFEELGIEAEEVYSGRCG